MGVERGGTPNSTFESNLNRLRTREDNENTWNSFIFQRQTCMLRQKKERTKTNLRPPGPRRNCFRSVTEILKSNHTCVTSGSGVRFSGVIQGVVFRT